MEEWFGVSSMIGPVVNTLLTLIAGLFSARWLLDAVEVSRTVASSMPPNDNESAEQWFLDLLRQAKTEIVMYDDGDTSEGSLYQSETVVEAIRWKLAQNPEFRLSCVLNRCDGATLFEEKLTQHDQVVIRARRTNPSRIHYKIIDNRLAYVSCHRPGHAARNRTVIDCTNAMSRRRKHPLALDRYFNDFEAHAAAA